MRVLLIGPAIEGGEGVYMDLLRSHPPADVSYSAVGGFHTGGPGATCAVVREVALNRLVHPRTVPDMGFRALRLRERFDLVHAHAHPLHLARRGKTPLIMSEGSSSAVYLLDYLGWDPDRLERGLRRTRRIYRALGVHDRLMTTDRVARVFVFSEWARDVNLRWGADPRKVEVVPPGFPAPPPVDRPDQETFSFLFVGTDFERKGGFEVVEAFDELSKSNPEARLEIVGSNPWERNPDRLVHGWASDQRRRRVLERLENLERRGLARNHGLVPSSEVRERFYPAADAFVMPTHAEGFGFTNVEAMSYGIPVISSLVGPVPEIVANERSGLLVPPGDVDALAGAMRRLLLDRDLGRRMGASGRAEFFKRYTIEHFRVGVGEVYRRAREG